VDVPVRPRAHGAGHSLLFRTIGGADGVLATIVHVPDMDAICSGDIVYNDIHMWLRRSAFSQFPS
jgi:hypothetical protein